MYISRRATVPEATSPQRSLLLPGAILAAVLLLTAFAPVLSPYDPWHTDPASAYAPPSRMHPLGADALGRDVLSRTLHGGWQTLVIAFFATAIAVLPGLIIGILAGYGGRWADRLLMAAADVLLAFPHLVLSLIILTLLGTGRLQTTVAVGVASMPAYARVARTATLQIRSKPYVEAAAAAGAGPIHILIWHVLPNARDTLFSFAAVTLSWAILNGAALAFLGFVGDISAPDWGVMLNEGRAAFRVAPWIGAAPGTAITLTIYAIHRLVGALQDGSI